jgi:hypothetical protein
MTFTGCENPLNTNIKFTALEFDKNGHFKETITYYNNYSKTTYSSNGDYEWVNESYEGASDDYDHDGNTGEGWIITDGVKGTYFYDKENYKLTINYKQIYGNDPSTPGSEYVWYNIITDPSNPYFDASITISFIETIIFFESFLDVAFVLSNNIYTHEYTYTKADRTTNQTIESFDFRTENKIINTSIRKTINPDNTVDLINTSKNVYTYTIKQTFPEGAKFGKGKSVAFYCDFYNRKVYSWDNNIGDFSTTSSSESDHYTINTLGTFVISLDGKVIYILGENYYRKK